MELAATIEPLTGPLPSVTWRWDPETDILAGSFQSNRKASGLTGSIEVSDEVGSIIVLDVVNGAICGLDIVVWPEVTSVSTLRVPNPLAEGRVVLPPSKGGGVDAIDIEAELTVTANADESIFHLRMGAEEESEVVRVADRLYLEVADGVLTGCWLTGVPPFPAGGEY